MSTINYTIESNPTDTTPVLVIQKNGAEYICQNKTEALSKIQKAQARFDKKTSNGLTPRTPRAEIDKLVFVSSFNI